MSDLKILILGAGGRMGGANIRAIHTTKGAALSAAVERAGSPHLGKDAAQLAGLEPQGVLISDDLDAAIVESDAIIDFTTPQASIDVAKRAKGKIHVVGTTGWTAEQDGEIEAQADHLTLVKSGNMSLGVNLLAALVEKAARALPKSFDIEVLEMHHRMKVDAPSGTALLLGEAAAKGRNVDLAEQAVRSRDGITGEREEDTIGFATLRGGTVTGEHDVIFAGEKERIKLGHIAEDRSVFAQGAIHAALWAKDKPAGLYSMIDVLGLEE